jgi:branched-chain amino acid transport system permease protein
MSNFLSYLIIGLALGGVFSLSGVGIVVLYRTTGVLCLAGGAVQAMGAFIAWTLVNHAGLSIWPAAAVAVLFGGLAMLGYGVFFGPPLAQRDPVVKTTATLSYLLVLLGVMALVWNAQSYQLLLPTTNLSIQVGQVFVNGTQVIGLGLGIVVTAGSALFLRVTRLGTAMRALADNRQVTAMLGVPVRRVEALAWFGSGLLFGATGMLLATLVGLDITGLTFLVISSLAAALIGRLQSLWLTLAGGIAIGVLQSELSEVVSLAPYQAMTPFVVAIVYVLIWAWRRPAAASRV